MKLKFSIPLYPTYKNIYFSFHLFSNLCSIFELKLHSHSKCSHAGIYFTFSLLKILYLQISIQDSRNWNFDKKRWNTNCEEYEIIYHSKILNMDELNNNLSYKDADLLLTDIIYLSPKIHTVLSRHKNHHKINEFYKEVKASTEELEEWLRSVVYKANEKDN